MNFQITFVACLLVAGFVGQASAQRNSSRDNSFSGLVALLSGKTLCAKPLGERSQECHVPGGNQWVYKLGPGNAVDPSVTLGNWSVTSGPIGSGNNARETVAYAYGDSSYPYCLCQTASTHTFNATGGSTTLTGPTLLSG